MKKKGVGVKRIAPKKIGKAEKNNGEVYFCQELHHASNLTKTPDKISLLDISFRFLVTDTTLYEFSN